MLEKGLLPEITWFHDLDAFQNAPIEINLERDLGLTDHGYKESWNTGSFFFKPTALDIFRLLKEELEKRKANEQPVMWILTKYNINGINPRIQKFNITYNIGMRHLDKIVPMAEKPIKVVHFPTHEKSVFEEFKPILNKELIRIISEKYGYEV